MTAVLGAHAPRLLHVMIRVHDLPVMLDFYCDLLGMHELRRIDFPAQRYTLVFIGYDAAAAQVEFWHDWPDPDRTAASPRPAVVSPHAGGHLGIGVRDISAACTALRAAGVNIRRGPAAMRPGGRVIALLDDPEGHEIELLASDQGQLTL